MSVHRIFLLLFAVMQLWLEGQEKLGTVTSNYASTNSIFFNPSSSADSRTFIQLRFTGVNAFGMTNMGYLPQVSLYSYLAAGEAPLPRVSESHSNRFVMAHLAAEGPCLVISKNNFGLGFFVSARSIFHVRRLPHQLASLVLSQEPIGLNLAEVNLRNAGFHNMSWLEGGINFSYIINKNEKGMLQLGMNAYYIIGFNYLHGRMQSMQGQYSDTLIRLSSIQAQMVRNTPAFNSGRGMGIDLGLTYKRMLGDVSNYMANSQRSNCRFIDYKYKLAFTLRDVGYIRFDEGVLRQEFSGSGSVDIVREPGAFTRIPGFDVTVVESTDPVRALLPLSLTGHFDYNFENSIYMSVVLMKNVIPLVWQGVQGNDLISLIPRVEIRDVEVAVPVTLQRFLYPQVGFGLRLRSFVVGVDNVFPLIRRSNVRHMGIYASLGVSIFKNPSCKVRRRSVNDCMSGIRIKARKDNGLKQRLFSRNKTYRR